MKINLNSLTIKKIKFYFSNKQTLFSFFSLVSLDNVYLKKNNFESMRRFLSRKFKKKLKFLIHKKTFKCPVFKKPSKNRMGKGKGKFLFWVWLIHRNQKVIELSYLKRKKIIFHFLKKLKNKLKINYYLVT